MPRRRWWRLTAAAVAAVSLATACGDDGVTEETWTNRMGTSGKSLTLDGRPWWPVGINAYQLGTDWRINAGCGAQVDLEEYFGALPPNTLTRVNVYSSFVVDKDTGALDFERLDAVFEAATRHHQLLNAVLASSEGACENGEFKGNAWFAGGWRTEVLSGEPMSFAEWIDTAVRRWGHSPAAAAWTPVGEPEPSNCGSLDCNWSTRQCPPNAAAALRRFVDEVGAQIRVLDPDSVLWGGRAGGGQCGAAGDDYAYVGASPGIDVLEYHDYEVGHELPGEPHSGLARRLQQARELDKPLVVAELGVNAGSCMLLQHRADLVARTVGELQEAGIAGVLFWAFVPDPRLGECTFDIGPDDPLLEMVGRGG
ncbi:MAG: beta-mannosidase [Mycobacterium sp.]